MRDTGYAGGEPRGLHTVKEKPGTQDTPYKAPLALRAREMAALYETSLEINTQPDLTTLLKAIVQTASSLVSARMGGLYLMRPDGERLELAVSHNLPGDHVGTTLRLGEGLSGRVAEAGEPMMVADYANWEGKAAIYAGSPIRRVLGVPLKVGDRVIGVIHVADDERTGRFVKDEVRLVSLFADQAVIAIENAMLFQAEREQREFAQALSQAAAAVSSTLDLDQILDHILGQVDRVIHGDAANIMLVEGDLACIVRSRGYESTGQDVLGLTIRLSEFPVLYRLYETGEAAVIPDTESDPNWVHFPEVAWVRSFAAAPIRARDQMIGFLNLDSATAGAFTQVHADRLRTFADQASLALSNAQLFRIVERAKRDWEGTFDAMQDPIVLIDRGHRIVRANQAFAGLVQVPLPDLVGQSYHAALEGARCPEPLCPLDQAVRNKRAATCLHQYEGRFFEIQATPVTGGAAEEAVQATHTIYAMRDITERKRAEQEIHRRNRELVLLNRIIAGSVTSPAPGSFLEMVCRELAQAFGASKSLATLINDDGSKVVVAAGYPADGQVSSLGESIPIEDDPCSQYLLQHPSLLVAEEVRTDPRLNSGHNLIEPEGTGSLMLLPLKVEGEVVGSLRIDATEPRAFSAGEVDLAQRVADQVSSALARIRLEEARRRLNAAVEQAAEAVVITATDQSIQYANPAFEHITGHGRASSLDKNPRQFPSLSWDPTVQIEMWQTITAGQTWQGRWTDARPDGTPYTVDSTVCPVRDQAGEIVNFVATLRDITREVELEKQFQQAQKMEALGRLAGGIAHDFNNLLTVIHLSTRLLERKVQPDESLLNHVQQIREAGERAARLTKQLLSFSRREVIEPRILDLNQIVGDLSQMLQRIIGEDIDLSIDLADDLWPVKVDPAQTEQVLMNLVVNSRDAMPDGGTLSLKTENVTLDRAYVASHVDAQPGDHVLLTVSDTGQGMSNEVQAHLFEPFFTTKEQGQGTGLGLSTVFGIVRRSGGHIRVESCEGKGTSFRIYLPRDYEIEVEIPAQFLRPDITSSERGTDTVLVVEDDVGVRHLAVRVLVSYGYHVLEAEGGPEALLISEQHQEPIHLLLTDVVMPQMNGRELVSRLRGQRPGLPVLYMSGYTDSATLQLGALPPNTAFLPKPFSVEDLIRKVRTLMAARG
jgi:PAS domain S-box-containing protein